MNVLVTGSAGFVGSELVRQLQAGGHRVSGIDLSQDVQSDLALQHDLSLPLSAAQTSELLALAPQVCVHLASPVGGFLFNSATPGLPERQAAMDRAVIELCGRCRCERLIFTSTINVFERGGGFVHAALREQRQASGYAVAKAHAEARLREAFADLTVLRPTNIYGWNQRRRRAAYGESHVIPDLLRKLTEPGPLEVLGDGSQRRNFVHVSDVCAFIVGQLESRGVHHLNLRSQLTLSIAELAHGLMQLRGSQRAVAYRDEWLRHETFRLPDFDLGPAYQQGWAPRIHSLAQGLRC